MKNYTNKYFSVLGDSISTLEGYSEPKDAVFYDSEQKRLSGVLTPGDTWWGKVIEALGGRLLVNNSWSGSTVCYHPLYEVESYACSDGRTSALSRGGDTPSVIMVHIGTNDWGAGLQISRYGSADLTLFSVAYGAMLKKLKDNYKNAEIWCL